MNTTQRAAGPILRAARQATSRPKSAVATGRTVAASALVASRQLHGRPAMAQQQRAGAGIVRAVLPVGGLRRYSQQAGGSSKIWSFEDIQKLTQQPKSNIVIVDVREPSELQSTGHIPGAVNIPVSSAPDSFHIAEEEFEDRFGRPRPAKDQEVVFYCKAGVRSRAAAGLAREAGWTNVGEYPGSWLDWAGNGGKVER